MTDSPANPWVALKMNGCVICAHCNCTTDAGEACSHIGVLLYTIMVGVQVREETACTSVACRWLTPSTVKKVYVLVSNIHDTIVYQ